MSIKPFDIETHTGRLIAALERNLSISNEMLEVTTSLTNALIANDTEQISVLDRRHQSLVQMLAESECERETSARCLIGLLGVSSGDEKPFPSLLEIAECEPEYQKRELLRLRSELLSVAESIEKANDRNRPLLDNALRFAHLSLQTLANAIACPSRYGSTGVHGTPPTFFIDQKC